MRQFRHIEVTKSDALALRELVRPFDNALPDFAKPVLTKLAIKVYAALIELENDIESVNISVSEDECLLLNQKIGNEDWDGALPLLRQSWAVLFELEYDMPPSTGFVLEELLKDIRHEEDDDNRLSTATTS